MHFLSWSDRTMFLVSVKEKETLINQKDLINKKISGDVYGKGW